MKTKQKQLTIPVYRLYTECYKVPCTQETNYICVDCPLNIINKGNGFVLEDTNTDITINNKLQIVK